eukprot:TRINITY_DN28102_c0_g1_i1.p1 TRINITY_DN28102_c0_g1~~TRINITY_DN28102_c0_g1_i1.p1  ORF type:complete len:304 (+),score=72.61 TRINITY_DN28102_c0_g1_i1:176-1087(+)
MARNEEKAMSALNRWTAQKRDLEMSKNLGKAEYMGGALPASASFGPFSQKKRPKIASEVNTVKECEHWRGEILRGCAKKIAEIQNASLGEHRIRDLNDEINKDLREKGYWEDQIKALGGADYKAQVKDVETFGAELASHTGYKYFGAAKDLPGVRELFESEVVPEAPRKTRKQLFKNIQPDYYGWRDEEDGMLMLAEQQAEHAAQAKMVAKWKAEEANRPAKKAKVELDAEVAAQKVSVPEVKPVESAKQQDFADFKAYVDVPTMEDIERLIVQKKKAALLKKYASAEQHAQNAESATLVSSE